MNPTQLPRYALFALAIAMPLIFFLNQPFNIANTDMQLQTTSALFGADCFRVFENLRDSERISHYRDKVHPYFSLFAVSVAKLGGVFHAEGAEFYLYRAVFGTLGVFFFWLLIFRETDHALLSFSAVLLLLSTFTVQVWSQLPETFIFGFATLMVALYLVRVKADTTPVFVISLSATTTNVFLGLIYLVRQLSWSRELVRKCLVILLCVLILSILQKTIYPSSGHFFDYSTVLMDRRHIGESSAPIPIKAFDFFYSGFVVPLSEGVPEKIAATQLWKEFFSGTSAYSPRVIVFTYAILVSVTAAALLCSYRFYRRTEKDEISKVVLTFLAFQFVLHMVYGQDPFLYSYHFLPMIILFLVLQGPRNLFSVVAIIACSWALQQIRAEQSDRFIRFFG